MDFKIPKFDELKDRLGIGEPSSSPRPRSSSSRDRDSYGEYGYEDYGEYGYDESADYAQQDDSSSSTFTAQLPKLVTTDDVRAHTQYTPAEPEQESASSQVTKPNRDFAVLREDSHRSPGVNSLFEPSSQAEASSPEQAASDLAASSAQAVSATGAWSQPASGIPAATAQTATPAPAPAEGRVVSRAARVVTVVKPESYADAERIAKILKSGDVAVLSLRNTPEQLGKRILDFSFGVACALDAQVECVAGHVFAITRGAGLTDAESARLKAQGLM